MSRDSMIEKVQKLLALADPDAGATEPERDLAMQRAQELMFRHGLAMTEIEAARGDAPEIVEERDTEWTSRTSERWQGNLAISVAKAVGCAGFWYMWGRRRQLALVGRAEDIAFVRQLVAYLVPTLEMEADAALVKAKESGEQTPCSGCSGEGYRYAPSDHGPCPTCDATGWRPVSSLVFRRSFYAAATSRIADRLKESRKAMVDNLSSSGMELVRIEDVAVKDFMSENHGDIKSTGGSDLWSRNGVDSGFEAGDRADLTPGAKIRGGVQRELARNGYGAEHHLDVVVLCTTCHAEEH